MLYGAMESYIQEEEDNLTQSLHCDFMDTKRTEECKLRKKLKFFFMNPIEKWKHKQRFPYKFLVQLLKVVLVTIQLSLFAHKRTDFIDYMSNNRITFSHLFLQGWDSSREITTYPPQNGDLAIYKTSEFFSAIDYAILNYAALDEAIGSYSYPSKDNSGVPVHFCFSHFKMCEIFSFNDSCSINQKMVDSCIYINMTNAKMTNFSSEEFFHQENITIQFSALMSASLNFGIKTINFKSFPPDCFIFNVTVFFDNGPNDGRIKLSLKTDIDKLDCKENTSQDDELPSNSIFFSILNSLVIILGLVSLSLCIRAIFRAQILKIRTVNFFRIYYKKNVSYAGRYQFLNMWYVTMIVSDILIIIGSVLKEKIEKRQFTGDQWNVCSVILGSGNFLIWFSVLRYLSFFKTYNIIILTMKAAAPAIFRFMVCVLLIYAGFTFCGWLILGPYNRKFRTLGGTSECLFALINGDDVYGTFSILEPTKSELIWWFSRIYLYVFISLFIYGVLSLFVSLILDAYESIKKSDLEEFSKTDVQEFLRVPVEMDLISESSSLTGCITCCKRRISI